MNVAQRRWVVTGKLDDDGGGEWLRESERNRIREGSEKYFYIILMCSMVK